MGLSSAAPGDAVASGGPGLQDTLGAALRTAMKARDRAAIAVLRSALARIANAEAVPLETMPGAGAIGHGLVGHGAADAPRRELTEKEVRTLVEAEVSEREHAAEEVRAVGRPDRAESLLAEAAVLRDHLTDPTGS